MSAYRGASRGLRTRGVDFQRAFQRKHTGTNVKFQGSSGVPLYVLSPTPRRFSPLTSLPFLILLHLPLLLECSLGLCRAAVGSALTALRNRSLEGKREGKKVIVSDWRDLSSSRLGYLGRQPLSSP